MACEKLNRLLHNSGQENGLSDLVASHIRTCPQCSHGIARLSRKLTESDSSTCEDYRSSFPAYYEATHHSDHPLISIDNDEIIATAEHLKECASCREEFEMFERLSLWEERGELEEALSPIEKQNEMIDW